MFSIWCVQLFLKYLHVLGGSFEGNISISMFEYTLVMDIEHEYFQEK